MSDIPVSLKTVELQVGGEILIKTNLSHFNCRSGTTTIKGP